MKRLLFLNFLFINLAVWSVAATDVWSAHIAPGDWKTTASVFNPGASIATVTLTKLDDSGSIIGSPKDFSAPPKSWTVISNTELNYSGSAHFVSSANLLVKISYQFDGSPSFCEFYLGDTQGTSWVIPNSVHSWFNYTGLAVLNTGTAPISVMLEAWNLGTRLNQTTVTVPAKQRYVRLSDGIWPGLGYSQFDTIIIRAAADIPAPLCITGNIANDRNLFFTAQPVQLFVAGDLYDHDSIVGNLRYAPAGTFIQGSPDSEPCRYSTGNSSETQFTHTLTHSMAVMETLVTRQMWTDLKAVQSSLPADPSNTTVSPEMSYPVQKVTWYEAVLFANLLSLQQGLTRCYYLGPTTVNPIDATNYDNPAYVYCYFSFNGYRLPSEGEWEYICRAGTTGPYWFTESNLNGHCHDITPGLLPGAEASAWFYSNSNYIAHPVGLKPANPWNLYDIPGNVQEWCWDCYYAYPTGAQTDYTAPWAPQFRVERGGSYSHDATFLRSACRNEWYPDSTHRNNGTGFRLVRTVN